MILAIDTRLSSTKTQETVSMTLAILLHALLLYWDPTLLTSHYKPIHDFVTIDIVEQAAPGGFEQPAPKKMSLMDTLKDMLMKPREEQIAHVAPQQPFVNKVAAPVQPALQNKNMPKPIATSFQPKSQMEDLASASSPNAIKTDSKNFNIPTPGPTLTTKSYGGIKAKDLPFQVGTDQQLAGGSAVIPIAVGNSSAKGALGYSNPSLKDAGKSKGISVSSLGSGPSRDISSIGGGASSTIEISGTGGTGNAPTGATHGQVLSDRSGGPGGGGRVAGSWFGSGRSGGGFGAGVQGIPSAAADLDAQLAASASGSGRGMKSKKGFEIAGPLNNRTIVRKVIPQYPAWAEEQGIIGSVRIWFMVTGDGQVRSNMRLTKTTGYPELDKLALDALRQWRFASFSSGDEAGQWGIITFTFSLSS